MRLRTFAAAAATLLVLALAAPAAAQEDLEVTPARVAGEDRFATAAAIADLTYPNGASVVVLANGMNFPDALAASYVSGLLDAPILLTEANSLHPTTEGALNSLDPEEVLVIGGAAAVSDGVVDGLIADGYTLDRVAGATRYETAAAAALRFGADPVGTIGGERVAVVASGENFPDALAVGPLAFGANLPLLLAQQGQLTVPTVNAIAQLDIDRLIVVGGTSVLPTTDQIVSDLQVGAGDVEVTRISGVNRYATAALVGDFALSQLGWTPSLTLLARGDTFPDALAASAHGGSSQAPLLLSESPSVLGSAAAGWLTAACPSVDVVRALGGTSAVSAGVLGAAITAAEGCEAEAEDDDNANDS
jgi:putative cell wall-binding protein